MSEAFEFSGRIAADHPALPGHFPGYPIVPGVVQLNQVGKACARWLPGMRITGWPQIKFASPLLPEEDFVIRLESTAPGRARFTLHVGERLVSSGQFTYSA